MTQRGRPARKQMSKKRPANIDDYDMRPEYDWTDSRPNPFARRFRRTTHSASTDVSVYAKAELYDIAFSFRNYRSEAGVMLHWLKRANGGRPCSVLELGAGPARHALEFARRGIAAWALDLSPAMVRYARGLARKQGRKLRAVQGDMRAFKLGRKFDLALLMMASDQHLLTENDFVRHLRCVGRHMNPGGIYIIESAYPEKPGAKRRVVSDWTQKRGGVAVTVSWGHPNDPWIGKARSVSVSYSVNRGGEVLSLLDSTWQRQWSPAEFRKLLRKAGSFDLMQTYGAFEREPVPDKKAWRLIYVLRRG